VTLFVKGRENLTCCVYYMNEINSKIFFFLVDSYVSGVILD